MIKKISYFLLQDKKNFIFLFFVIFVTSLLETLGVFSILPFLAVLSNTSLIETNFFLKTLYQSVHVIRIRNETEFIIFLGILSFLAIIISVIFRVMSIYLIGRFSFNKETFISSKLMKNYLYQPYIWFLNQNSANIGKTISEGT